MRAKALYRLPAQMTVELAVVLPAVIAIAIVCTNAMTFFSECAAFDVQFRDAVRVYAAAPAASQTTSQSVVLVQQVLESGCCDKENLRCAVRAQRTAMGHVRYDATLSFLPSLFGLGLKSEVFGVSLPELEHRCSFVVDGYKPGILL